MSQHKTEPQVISYENAKDRKTRNKIILKLRNLGNHLHNSEVLKAGEGTIEVVYRNPKVPYTSYIPCKHCLGYYNKSDLWKHVKCCPLNVSEKTKGERHVAKGRLLLATKLQTSTALQRVVSVMVCDDVSLAAKGDWLIMSLGQQMLLKHGHDTHKHSHIRNVMRELGRLLVALRSRGASSQYSLADFLHPRSFNQVVLAVKKVCGYDEGSNIVQIPSLALRLGASVAKATDLLHTKALKACDEALVTTCSGFSQLLAKCWNVELSANAHRTLNNAKKNSVKLLPLSNDVKSMSDHLKKTIAYHMGKLRDDKTSCYDYRQLQKALLTLMIVFSRRRSGEVSRMKLAEYHAGLKNPSNLPQHNEFGLTELERALCSKLTRVEIDGKRGRNVPMLLTEKMKECLDLLISCRGSVGIGEDNPFVFASTTGFSSIRGHDCVREHSMRCGAQRPEALRATCLRKHIATMTQILNLSNNELDIVARFLGHDIAVHRQYYRLPESTVQVAKVSKLLYSMESGTTAQFHGQALDDINVDINDDLESKLTLFFRI